MSEQNASAAHAQNAPESAEPPPSGTAPTEPAPTDEKLPADQEEARKKGASLLAAVGEMAVEERTFWDKTFIAAVSAGKDVDEAAAFGLFSVLSRRTLMRAAYRADEERLTRIVTPEGKKLVAPVPGAFQKGPKVTRGLR